MTGKKTTLPGGKGRKGRHVRRITQKLGNQEGRNATKPSGLNWGSSVLALPKGEERDLILGRAVWKRTTRKKEEGLSQEGDVT